MIENDPTTLPVLLVDDEPQVLRSMELLLRSSGIEPVMSLEDSRKVLPLLADRPFATILLDLSMPHITGEELLEGITSEYPDIPVIIVTTTNDLDTAVKCVRVGAFDYLVKPVEKDQLLSSIKRAMEMSALRNEVMTLRESIFERDVRNKEAFSNIITRDAAMLAIFRYLVAISVSTQPALITGETGTGKELIARAIHQLSGRSGEFVVIDSAGLDDNLFSDTLFGHTKGAYTNAIQEREGLVARAKGGTLFLDEIGDLSAASQIKLLRLFQENTYYPVGSDKPQQSDARFVVATHRNVEQLVEEDRFRKDLYYRLRAHCVDLPSLRDRQDDIPLLIEHFLNEAANSLNKPAPTVPGELTALLKNYHWPGNVREFKAVMFDAVARNDKGVLPLQSFRELLGASDSAISSTEGGNGGAAGLDALLSDHLPTLKEAESFLIDAALQRADGNQGTAAAMLGISRQALNKRLVRSRKVSEKS
ncbi:MAG: sigma-54-dependent Fis family transcriptional regulator [Gammaproteobacteria bacterium]|nr:MAG: sigma-54-dependent Fis family transcriptional regulator [Gammaproteobacteria bacterium]